MAKHPTGLKAIFSKNLKLKREEMKLTQDALGKRAKVSGRYISQLERNEINVTLDTVELLSTALKTPVAELLLEAKYLNSTKKAALDLAVELIGSIRANLD